MNPPLIIMSSCFQKSAFVICFYFSRLDNLHALAEDGEDFGAGEGAVADGEDEDGVGDGFEVFLGDAQLAGVHHHADVFHPGFEAGEALGGDLLVALALGAHAPNIHGETDELVEAVVHHMAVVGEGCTTRSTSKGFLNVQRQTMIGSLKDGQTDMT